MAGRKFLLYTGDVVSGLLYLRLSLRSFCCHGHHSV